jgi:hypothetical protein
MKLLPAFSTPSSMVIACSSMAQLRSFMTMKPVSTQWVSLAVSTRIVLVCPPA